MLLVMLALGCAFGDGSERYDKDDDGFTNAELDEGDDCDDNNAQVHPGAQEVCGDGIDNNCDGVVDDDGAGADEWFLDSDSDGHGTGEAVTSCSRPEGMASVGDDCDDTDAEVRPTADEVCNDGIDNNCDGGPGACEPVGIVDASDVIQTTINDRKLSGLPLLVMDSDGDGADDIFIPSDSLPDFRLHRGPFGVTVDGSDSSLRFDGWPGRMSSMFPCPDRNGDGIPEVLVVSENQVGEGFIFGFESVFSGGGYIHQPDFTLASEVPTTDVGGMSVRSSGGTEWLVVGSFAEGEWVQFHPGDPQPQSWDEASRLVVPDSATTAGGFAVSFSEGTMLTSTTWGSWSVYPSGSTTPTGGTLEVPVDFIPHGPVEYSHAGTPMILMGLPGFLTENHSEATGESGKAVILPIPADSSVLPADAVVQINGDTPAFGWAVSALDFNGDGTPDIAVSEPGEGPNSSKVHVFYGPLDEANLVASDADLTIVNHQVGSFFGFQLYAGDTNGDGADDLIVDTVGGGRVYIIPGSGL